MTDCFPNIETEPVAKPLASRSTPSSESGSGPVNHAVYCSRSCCVVLYI